MSLDAVKAMLPERAVLCFTDGGFRAEGRRGTGVHRQDTCCPLRGLPSTHATLHLASMTGVLGEEEEEARRKVEGRRGLEEKEEEWRIKEGRGRKEARVTRQYKEKGGERRQ